MDRPAAIFITGESVEEIYTELLTTVKNFGQINGKVRELLDVNLVLKNPQMNFIRLNRNWAWCMWEMYDRLNRNFQNPGNAYVYRPVWKKKLEKEGGKFTYTYGNVYKRYVHRVISRMKSKGTRDCVMTMWDNDYLRSRDRTPCTLSLHFLIRDNKLDLYVDMRTNDVINLLPYDIWHHSTLQILIAQQLRVEVGYYRHKAHMMYWQKRRDNTQYVDNAIQRLSSLKPYNLPADDTSNIKNDLIMFYQLMNSYLRGRIQSWEGPSQSIKSTFIREWMFELVNSHSKLILNQRIILPEPTRLDFQYIRENL